MLAIGGVLILIANVFGYGVYLQTELDETI
jgi:hypothetical protein